MLDFTATQNAFDNGKRAHTLQNYEKAIMHYTQALEALQEDVASVMYAYRAAAHEMRGEYNLAIEDGERADPTLDSTCPDPYIVRANSLFLQGDLQTSQSVYSEVSERVPIDSAQHGTIASKYSAITALIMKQKGNLVQTLPYEIISGILSQLSTVGRARLGMTCKFWNNYIFHEWPYMWHTINNRILPSDEYDVSKNYIGAIQGIQVKDLSLKFRVEFDHREEYHDYFNDEEAKFEEIGLLRAISHSPDQWVNVESLCMLSFRQYIYALNLTKTSP